MKIGKFIQNEIESSIEIKLLYFSNDKKDFPQYKPCVQLILYK